jgi:hypothetical protein
MAHGLMVHVITLWLQAVLGIRIRMIRMFLGLPDPDPDPLFRILPLSHKGVQRTEIMPAKYNCNTNF